MGNITAHDLVENVIDIKQSIYIHLTGNHYPPVPPTMVEPCIEAIYAASDGDWNRLIELPSGVTWKGQTNAPVSAIVEAHHLDAWIDSEE